MAFALLRIVNRKLAMIESGSAMKQDKSQLERFKEAAREIGADDDEERFNEKLRKIAKPKPVDEKTSNG